MMGYGAAFCESIEEESIKKFCPKEYDYFIDLIDEREIDLEEFAKNAAVNELGDYAKDIVKAYTDLQKAFTKETDLGLYIDFQDPDSGDRYDEISGIYWAVNFDDMYQLTPAGKKIGNLVTRKFYVVFG